MGPPTTRSQSQKGNPRVEATHQSSISAKMQEPLEEDTTASLGAHGGTELLANVFMDLGDASTVSGRDAKLLRDMTIDAIENVRQEARRTSSRLAEEIREGNNALLVGLNETFANVSIPGVAAIAPDGLLPHISTFSGTGESPRFSVWLRRFEDILRMRTVPLSSERKANMLVGYLEGVAREKIEELSDDDRKSFEAIVAHLKNAFEGPHQRHLARQSLSSCKQEVGEPSAIFANRLLNLVRAATVGYDPTMQKERMLEEFIARLRPDVRYFVKLDNPSSFEQAVNKAMKAMNLQGADSSYGDVQGISSMQEEALLASDAEMRSHTNSGSDRGSSILASIDSVTSSSSKEKEAVDEKTSESRPAQYSLPGGGFHTVRPPNSDIDADMDTDAPRVQGFSRESWNRHDDAPQQEPSSPSSISSTSTFHQPLSAEYSKGRSSHQQRIQQAYPPHPQQGRAQSRSFRAPRAGRRGRMPPVSHRSPDSQDIPDEGHHLIGRHPWAHLVKPRRFRLEQLRTEQVSNELPEDKYRPLPSAGYLSKKFCRSLFPTVLPRRGIITATMPFLELTTLEDAILFRQRSEDLIHRVLDGSFELPPPPAAETIAPKGIWSSCIIPPKMVDSKPVLYQVVAVKSNALVLEAKDFFIFMPDRRELHCILLDRFAFNVVNSTYGYDRTIVSVRDFVWVYNLLPVATTLTSPSEELQRARLPRTAALDTNTSFFFRTAQFAFVTPPIWQELRYGIVLSLTRRGDGSAVNNFEMAIEGSTESVTITKGLARFRWPDVRENEIMKTLCRRSSSCAVRFSEPPASPETRDQLCQLVKLFLPANPDEGVLPMEVHKLTPSDEAWFRDRLGNFDNFLLNHDHSLTTMTKIFNAAASALAAITTLGEDRETHRVTATVPNLAGHPLRLEITIPDMTTEAGWERHRPVGVWLIEALSFIRMSVDRVTRHREARQLRVTLKTYFWTDRSLRRAIMRAGRIADNSAVMEICVKLGRLSSSTIPAYEAVCQTSLLTDIPHSSCARATLNRAYGATPLGCAEEGDPASLPAPFAADELTVSLGGRRVQLTDDQRQALAIGNTAYPVLGIQAAFGSGKTVVGACIAAQQARSRCRVIVTASTNNAVAQITESIRALDDFRDLEVCRYVAETVAFDDTIPQTDVDMHEILKGLAERFYNELEDDDLLKCERFREGRLLFESHMRQRDRDEYLAEDERDELLLAERDVSNLTERMVRIMFERVRPDIVAITTSSLLNATGRDGIFEGYLNNFKLVLCDEASQVPEPVFAAILSRLPRARHIYIGDVKQLEPYARCSRYAAPAQYGARSVMDFLTCARSVPMAPLITTFRAHPLLNDLPNEFVYDGTLRSDTAAAERRMLLNVMRFPNAELPFMFIDVRGRSRKVTYSHHNELEATVCTTLVERLMARGIASRSICIITFYKEQHRRLADFARETGVDLSTVDAIQGREKDVVILLTTKTDFAVEASEFLDDPHRMNVALTRCKHGQFVLGKLESLDIVPFWRSVIGWARSRGAIVPTGRLDAYLPMEA